MTQSFSSSNYSINYFENYETLKMPVRKLSNNDNIDSSNFSDRKLPNKLVLDNPQSSINNENVYENQGVIKYN